MGVIQDKMSHIIDAEVISTGTELILGKIADTNAQFIAKELTDIGIELNYVTVVGDNLLNLTNAIKNSLKRAKLIIITGGLGPTSDDLTAKAVANALGEKLVRNDVAKENMLQYFKYRGFTLDKKNNEHKKLLQQQLKQCMLPQSSKVIKNDIGTASGFYIENEGKHLFVMPGVPSEMKYMFTHYVKKMILKAQKDYPKKSIHIRTLKVFGIPEAVIENKIKSIFGKNINPFYTTTVDKFETKINIVAKSRDKEKAVKLIVPYEKAVLNVFKDDIFGFDDDLIEEAVVRMCKENKITLSTAESVTGGLIGKKITDIAGSSEIFLGGVVSYSNESKNKILKVKEGTLTEFGAVSEQTAKEMAIGVKEIFNSDYSISTTGIAGPSGGTDRKPVGLVYICVSTPIETYVEKYIIKKERQEIREITANIALNILRKKIVEQTKNLTPNQ